MTKSDAAPTATLATRAPSSPAAPKRTSAPARKLGPAAPTKAAPVSSGPSTTTPKPKAPPAVTRTRSNASVRPSSTPPISRSVSAAAPPKKLSPLSLKTKSTTIEKSDSSTSTHDLLIHEEETTDPWVLVASLKSQVAVLTTSESDLQKSLDLRDTEYYLLRAQVEGARMEAETSANSFANELNTESVFSKLEAENSMLRKRMETLEGEKADIMDGLQQLQAKMSAKDATKDTTIEKLERKISLLTEKKPGSAIAALLAEKESLELRHEQVVKDKDLTLDAMRKQIEIQVNGLFAEVAKSEELLVSQAQDHAEELKRLNSLIDSQAAVLERFQKAMNLKTAAELAEEAAREAKEKEEASAASVE
ncbi:hypothetical protein HDU78_011202 [Chytriomyces hyalinus]|nr:hypothetical protein HDU78_011202 [Chytriomyces hyalinus]